MALLTWLTLIVVAVVVATLAIYLTLIAIALIRANRNLAALVGGLEAIRASTASLERDLPAINDAAGVLGSRLKAIDSRLVGIIRLVQR